MRLLILSVASWFAAAGAVVLAQSGASGGPDVTQLPVGQIYKAFQYPYWEAGQLKYILSATEAKGITINRAETTNLKIDIYTNGKVTTTITSPDADIYVADRKMRTDNTVKITRPDLTATAKFCDFDLLAKQYTLRTHVKVILLHFDMNSASSGRATGVMGVPPTPASAPKPATTPSSTGGTDSMLETPGAYSNTNNAPLPQ